MATSILDSIVDATPAAASAPSDKADNAENGRLTTGLCILTIAQLGIQIQNAGGAFGKLADASPQQVGDILAEIMKAADGIRAKAAKLLAANR